MPNFDELVSVPRELLLLAACLLSERMPCASSECRVSEDGQMERCYDRLLKAAGTRPAGVTGTSNEQRQVREDSQGLGEPGRLSPSSRGVPASQPPFTFHWLVELRPAFEGHPHFEATYYAGWMEHPLEAAKTKDPLAAARFARKEDAERVAKKLGHTLSCVWQAIEHGFSTDGVEGRKP